jgi:hypothetical protein
MQLCEAAYNVVELWLWLSQRFTASFSNRPEVEVRLSATAVARAGLTSPISSSLRVCLLRVDAACMGGFAMRQRGSGAGCGRRFWGHGLVYLWCISSPVGSHVFALHPGFHGCNSEGAGFVSTRSDIVSETSAMLL